MGELTFHWILLSSHDVDKRALQRVHVQTVVHSGAVLKNTRCEALFNADAELIKQTQVMMHG